MEYFWEYWYWYWFMLVVFYYVSVIESMIGIKYFFASPVRYTPPKGVGVLLSGLIYDGFSEQKDFVAAILELKVRGFVDIEYKYNNDMLIRVKENVKEIATEKERYLLDEILFINDNNVYLIPKILATNVRRGNDVDRVLTRRAKEMVKDQYKLVKQIAKWAVEEGYMLENPRKTRRRFFWVSTFLIAIMLGMCIISKIVPVFLAFVLLFFFYMPILLFFQGKYVLKILSLLWMSPLIVPIVLKFHIPEFREALIDEMHLWLYVLVAVVEVAFILLYEHVAVLSFKGKEVKNHLIGLKKFLKRVKLDEVNKRQEEDERYVDKVLPYMVLLDIKEHDLDRPELKYHVR